MDTAQKHLAASDPRFAALIARAKPFAPRPSVLVRPFDARAASVASPHAPNESSTSIRVCEGNCVTIDWRVSAVLPGLALMIIDSDLSASA